MVKKNDFIHLLLTALLVFNSCTVDVLGIFGSGDLDERLANRDTFNYLTPADLSLVLPATYSFLVVSDTHIEDGNAFGLEKLKDVVTADDKFVVITGDITQNGSRQDIEKFTEIGASLRSIGIPCYPVIGNHDIYFGNYQNWKELIGSTRYRVDSPASTTTLLFLDSANAFFGAEQLDWLESELKTAQDSLKSRVFVFTHTNFFVEKMSQLMQETDIRERARTLSLLKGRCDSMFTGHVHARMQKTVGGVRYVTLEDYRSQSTYCRVNVSPGGIRYEFLKL